MKVRVSGVIICGDSGALMAKKSIDSVTVRGLVDEVVVGFNGSKNRDAIPSSSNGVPVHVHHQEWRKDFALARNLAHRHAAGEWHLRWDSVTGEVPVLVRKVGDVHFDYIEIQDLIPDSLREKKRVEWERVNLEVMTHKGWQKLKAVLMHRVKKRVFRFVDEHGMIRVTEDHSLFSGGKEIWGRAVKRGTRLDHVNLGRRHGPQEASMTPELAEVWGFFAAEGHCEVAGPGLRTNRNRYLWRVSNSNLKLLRRYQAVLEAAYARRFYLVKDKKKGFKAVWHLCATDSKDIASWFRPRFYSGAGRKKVPMEILNGSAAVMAAFACGFEWGDGHWRQRDMVHPERRVQTWSLDSPILAAGLHYLYRCGGRKLTCDTIRRDKPHIVKMRELFEQVRALGYSAKEIQRMRMLRKAGDSYATIVRRFGREPGALSHFRKLILGKVGPEAQKPGPRKLGVKDIYEEPEFEGAVYDLCTAVGTFVGGVGDFVLHNTDDVLVSATHPEILRKCQQVNMNPIHGMSNGDGARFRMGLDQLEKAGTNLVMSPYYYQVDEQDRPVVQQTIRRLVRWSTGWEWERRIHEDLRPTGNNAERFTYDPTLLFIQRQDPGEPRQERNREIHAEYVKDLGPASTYRDWYNAGAMAMDLGDSAEAVKHLTQALSLCVNRDMVFTLGAREQLMHAHLRLQQFEEARLVAQAIMLEDPDSRHGYLAFASCYYHQQDFPRCVTWFRNGLTKKQSVQFAPDHALIRWILPAAWAAEAMSQMGQHADARVLIDSVIAECNWETTVHAVSNNIALRQEQAAILGSVQKLVEFWTPRDPKRAELARSLLPGQVIDTPPGFTIWAPAHVEPWEPSWVHTNGLGGSEEAIVYLSEELVRRGKKVTVYSPVSREILWNGVIYRPLASFDANAAYDVLIGHRCPPPAPARTPLSWHHDHAWCGPPGNYANLFVSNWQARVLGAAAGITTLNGAVIGNGVPEEQCEPLSKEGRDPSRVVYASQPIRGLERLLDIWPEIREARPDATLDVYYGFQTNEKLGETNPEMKKATEEIQARLQAALQDGGIVHRGRVSHPELMRAFRSSGVWAYPCAYPEVSCIAGLRATAAGCIPVFLADGANALDETQITDYMVTRKWEEGGRELFIAKLIAAMLEQSPSYRERLRTEILARSSWSVVVDRFLTALPVASKDSTP